MKKWILPASIISGVVILCILAVFIGRGDNTQTGDAKVTIYFRNGKSHTFTSDDAVTMTTILTNLNYDKNRLCDCLSEYTVDTELGIRYGIHLTEGYARCDKGQAELTQNQIDTLKKIVLQAQKETVVGSASDNYSNYPFC